MELGKGPEAERPDGGVMEELTRILHSLQNVNDTSVPASALPSLGQSVPATFSTVDRESDAISSPPFLGGQKMYPCIH